VVDQEDFDSRMRRLRQATAAIEPPPELVDRVVSAAKGRPTATSWVDAIVMYARWALVPAALASALLAAASWSDAGDLEEALYLGSSVGYLP
jgi:hypothetical protein